MKSAAKSAAHLGITHKET